MRSWRGRISVLIFLLAAGCRAAGNQELLERELRLLEDEIYHLEDHVDEYRRKLDSCRRQNAALRSGSSLGSATLEPQLEAMTEGQFDLPSDSGLAAPLDADEPPAEIQIEIPPSRSQENTAPGDFRGTTPPMFVPPGGGQGVDESRDVKLAPRSAERFHRTPRFDRQLSPETEEVIEDYQLAEITLNRLLTGGFNNDDLPGDEGIMAVVEPRNAAKQIIRVPGKLSIVVLDPSLPQRESRVARWDFTPDEAAAQFHPSLLGRGIHLELPWLAEYPTNAHLQLYVRYITADGAEFRTDQPIEVEISAATRADRWTSTPHSSARRPSPPDGWELPARRNVASGEAPSSRGSRGLHDERSTDWQTLKRQAQQRSTSSVPQTTEAPDDEQKASPRTAKKRRRVEWSPDRR